MEATMAAIVQLPEIAAGPAHAAPSGIREVVNEALTMPDAIRLEVGEPDFATPEHIVEAAVEFARSGRVRYTATAGTLSLREKLSAKLARVNGVSASVDDINCAVGGVGAIAAAMAAVVEAGDQVLVPDPAWPNYRLMLSWIGAELVSYPCPAENGFLPDVEALQRLIGPRVKMLVINSPCNPTGVVFPRTLIEELAELAERANIYLLSDECYDEVILEGTNLSPASFLTDGRVISAYSFSKTYAMTGWRVGYVVANRSIAQSINKVLESNSSCVSALCQHAAEAALDGSSSVVTTMVDAYRRRRDLSYGLLADLGLAIAEPHGAFYVMADVSRSGLHAREFAFDLLRSRSVAVAPGTAFGDCAREAVRISLASSEDALREGISRMAARIVELEQTG
jgi:aspartate aminotransferase